MNRPVDAKLREAIDFFEKMLQTMPGDRTGLEFLSVAYEQTGEQEKQIKALVKLSETLLKEGDLEHAGLIGEKLRSFPDAPEAVMAARVVERIVAKGGTGGGGSSSNDLFIEEVPEAAKMPETPVAVQATKANLPGWTSDAAKAELEIVWHWNDDGVLPKEVCMEMLHVFMDHPVVVNLATLVSALGLLQEQHPEYADTAFESMQKRSKLPPIPLELLEVQQDAINTLPIDYIKVKGVMPFRMMANELLVAVMNGVDRNLREEIAAMTGKKCHFYLLHPRAWFMVSPVYLGQEQTLG